MHESPQREKRLPLKSDQYAVVPGISMKARHNAEVIQQCFTLPGDSYWQHLRRIGVDRSARLQGQHRPAEGPERKADIANRWALSRNHRRAEHLANAAPQTGAGIALVWPATLLSTLFRKY
jgi:hypothetical protein